MKSIEIPVPIMPKDYKIFELELIVKGECNKCSVKNRLMNDKETIPVTIITGLLGTGNLVERNTPTQ